MVLSNTASYWLDTLCVAGIGAIGGKSIPFARPQSIELSEEKRASYVGTYRTEDGDPITIKAVHDALVIQAPGQPPHVLWALRPDLFFLKTSVGSAAFKRRNKDPDAPIEAVRIQFMGATLEGSRE